MRSFPVINFYRPLAFNEPLEGVDSFDVLLDMIDSVSNDSGFYPGFQHRFVGLLFYWIRIFRVQDDMSTCRSVQETSASNILNIGTDSFEPFEVLDFIGIFLDIGADFSAFSLLFSFFFLAVYPFSSRREGEGS